MSMSLCFTPLSSLKPPTKPGLIVSHPSPRKVVWLNDTTSRSENARIRSFELKAAENEPTTKKKRSIVCENCEGNGAVACSQCNGNGVNSVDHFNGQFKAGQLCWLCRGKKEMLCGDCNGAGFLGGFMSTFDE
ncbi:protein BUNDLE SHEATH DEFECTIVE 2, chloroplastic-like [Impatiens glandulifera]|uniref:protein BUNDLE SHEATH DEFECTIVE 2, chloroplastic-like n=1 Tax=Impatiens glandulifera TaxID=253017 RepID=UPI001FB16575|nr:protein BUNDLE SHEATH DEFECTIVE 2, chloroplastic-like [Impatiens glandulifera]